MEIGTEELFIANAEAEAEAEAEAHPQPHQEGNLVSQMNQEFAFESDLLFAINERYQSLVGDTWAQLGVGSEYKDDQQRLFVKEISEVIFTHRNRQIQYLNETRELLSQREALAANLRRFLGSFTSPLDETSHHFSNVPYLPRLTAITEDIGVLEQQKQDRIEKMKTLQSELFELHAEMGKEEETKKFPKLEKDEDFSADKLAQLQTEYFFEKEEKARRHHQVEALRADIAQYRNLMGSEEEDALFLVDLSSTSTLPSSKKGHLSLKAIDRLQRLRAELIDEKRERERQLASLQQRLNALWNHLNVSNTERELFLSTFSNSTPLSRSNIAGIRFEVARLEELKKMGISTKLQEVRSELRKVWDLLSIPTEDRDSSLVPPKDNFSSSSSSLPGSEMLPLIDVEKDSELKDKEYEEAEKSYEKCLTVLKSLESKLVLRNSIEEVFLEREALLEEKNALQAAYDPSRLLSKKPGLSALLLKEQKARDKIERKLPKVESDLVRHLTEWKKNNHTPLLFSGRDVLSELQQQHLAHHQRHHRGTAAAGAAATTTASHPHLGHQSEKEKKEERDREKENHNASATPKRTAGGHGSHQSVTPAKRVLPTATPSTPSSSSSVTTPLKEGHALKRRVILAPQSPALTNHHPSSRRG